VIHSTTKYINGHSDVIGGAVIAASEHHYRELAFLANALGLTESPWDAWMVLRGVKTLAQRMEAHARNAQVLAEFLAEHPAVKKVYYPGLPSHPQHALAAKQSGGFGGMVTFDIDADKGVLDQFFSRLRYFALAESLGGVESLIEAPWFMSHASMSAQHRRAAGISPGTVRVSAGLEDSADLLDDLRDGLSKL
jgi:cystathionine gamma-synthase